jgi:hypothetical protein
MGGVMQQMTSMTSIFGQMSSSAGNGDADGTQSGADINIGVGEIQECTITKSMDVPQDLATIDDLVINAVISGAPDETFDFKAMEAADASGGAGRDLLIGGAGPDTEPYDSGRYDLNDFMTWQSNPPVSEAELQTDVAALAADTQDAGVKRGALWGGSGSDAYQQTQARWESDGYGDNFVFQASEPTTAEQTHPYLEMKLFSAKVTSWSVGASAADDGTVDAAESFTFGVEREMKSGIAEIHFVEVAGGAAVETTDTSCGGGMVCTFGGIEGAASYDPPTYDLLV